MRKIAVVLALMLLVAAKASAATWTPRAPLPAARCAAGSGIAVVNGSIVLIGEANDEYSIAGDSWSANTPYPRADGRTNLNSNAVLGNDVYFVGGTSVSSGLDVGTIDKYNAATDVWTLDVAGFLPNASAGTIVHDGTVYSFGGTFLGAASLAFSLTPPSSSIFVHASLPTPRVEPAVVELGGALWVIGGTNGAPLTAVEIFDPVTGDWSSGPSLPVASAPHAAGVIGGDIHVLLDAGVYRLGGGAWTLVGPPPPQSGDYAAVFDGPELHAIGGCSTEHYVLSIAGDTTPPVIASVTASPSVLPVANHKLVAVTVRVVASDDSDPAPVAQIVSVTNSEPDNGLGDGDLPGDIVVTGPLTLQLRAERSGKGPGRTYTITVRVTDASGNSESATTTVVVPRGK